MTQRQSGLEQSHHKERLGERDLSNLGQKWLQEHLRAPEQGEQSCAFHSGAWIGAWRTTQETMDISWSKRGSDNRTKSFVTMRKIRQWKRCVHRGRAVSIPRVSHYMSQKIPEQPDLISQLILFVHKVGLKTSQNPFPLEWSCDFMLISNIILHCLMPWRFHPTYVPAYQWLIFVIVRDIWNI